MFTSDQLHQKIVSLVPLLLSLTVHEYAHARTALAFGDPTARDMGRVSLNPLRHLDFWGTIMLVFSGLIGWAKPVPVNPANLHPRRLGDAVVSLAGPASNLCLALIAAGLMHALVWLGPQLGLKPNILITVYEMLFWAFVGNVGLCIFNLIPLFPLDGHHVLREMLPSGAQLGFMQWQVRFGQIALMALIVGPAIYESATRQPCPIDPLAYFQRYFIFKIMALMGLEM